MNNIDNLSVEERIKLLKDLIDSFDIVGVTGLYGSQAEVLSGNIEVMTEEELGYFGYYQGNQEAVVIRTDICSG